MRLYVIARHGESTLNFENRINGDPTVGVELTENGRQEAALLGQQVAHLPLELCVHSRFPRTRETAEIALAERDVPDYIEVDHNKMTAKLARVPAPAEVPYPVMMEPHLVVEFYSR